MPKASPIIKVAGRQIAVDLPHLLFATGIGGWVAWYCWDAWRHSSDVENMILIMPVSIIAIVLYLFVAAGSFKRVAQPVEESPSPNVPAQRGNGIKIAVSMALLGAFVIAGPWIGFDVASFAYVLLMMFFLGERRIPMLLIMPLLFSVTVIYCFSTLLSTPLPVFFAWGHYS